MGQTVLLGEKLKQSKSSHLCVNVLVEGCVNLCPPIAAAFPKFEILKVLEISLDLFNFVPEFWENKRKNNY